MESGARQPHAKLGAAVWVTWGSLLKCLTTYQKTLKPEGAGKASVLGGLHKPRFFIHYHTPSKSSVKKAEL